jgi:RNA polymerase sigma-70 factor (ECF subfamily)
MTAEQSSAVDHSLEDDLRDRLRAFIAARVRNPADVDDIVQDVFLRAYRRLNSLESSERFVAWVYQIARNAIVDHYRAAATRRESPLEAATALAEVEASLPWADDDRDAAQLRRELASCLTPLMDALPPDHRQAIHLTEIEGVTQRAAADRLGISVSGMKSRVQRARRGLKDRLLECCRIELDRRGGIVEYAQREESCQSCGAEGTSCG